MNVNGVAYRSIWLSKNNSVVKIIDQRLLPHKFEIKELKTIDDAATAIKDMQVRGAGLIGATAGYGMYLAVLEAPKNNFDEFMTKAAERLKGTRPTAVNLENAVERQLYVISKGNNLEERIKIALKTAINIADEDAEYCRRIGQHGLKIIEEISKKKEGEPVNILTHCNAGWLAFVDYGSALSPIYAAHDVGIKTHVWVSETRPRNQGAKLTAWELLNYGIPYHIIIDSASRHLMQKRMVDLCILGADRVTSMGDVANKIGTYLKSLAAYDNNIPFYIALPSSSFDWNIKDGKEISIEERGAGEVIYIEGLRNGEIKKCL